jgi:catechol 2,3-dioxygenase-like lactoylglutathione lyase family enzyme
MAQPHEPVSGAARQTIGAVTLLVSDYDEAIAYFTESLGFALIEDRPLGENKRWVLVAPPGGGVRLLLAEAGDERQAARIGDQTGGRVFLFLHTDDFQRDHERLRSRGVRFLEAPRDEPYGWVAVFEDRWGNRWDLLQLKQDRGPGSSR